MNNNEKLAKVAVNKSLLKEYSNSEQNRIVYMNDGTEFQIQVFNPYNYTIGVSFNFNENLQGNSNLLVLRPGERVWLERYLDNESKLLFSTYEVSNSNSIKNIISNNGNLCIKFFKEKQQNTVYINNYNPWITCTYDNNYYSSVYTSSCDYNPESIKLSANINDCVSSAASTFSASTSINSDDKIVNVLKNKTNFNKSIETGRIEQGSHSNQKFKNVYKDFEYWPFKTEHIKILPTSQKQITSNDLQKKYCHQCGRKLNQKYKFCPFCGAKQ